MSNLVGSILPLRMFYMVDSMDMGPFRDLVALCDKAPYTIDPSLQEEICDIIERFETNQKAVQKRILELQQHRQGTIKRVTRAIQHSNVSLIDIAARAHHIAHVTSFQNSIGGSSTLGRSLLCLQERELIDLVKNTADTPLAISTGDAQKMKKIGGALALMYEGYFDLVFCAKRIESLTKEKLPEMRAEEEANFCDKVTEWLAEETRKMREDEGAPPEIEIGDVPLPLVVAGAIIGENSKLLARVVPLHAAAILSQIKKILACLKELPFKTASFI